MIPYVSVENHRGTPSVKVKVSATHFEVYPLTKRGCLAAGRALFAAGAENWMCASSVDFPRETKPGFRGDARQFINDGFQAELEAANAVRLSVVSKMCVYCMRSEFQDTLSSGQKAAFRELFEQVKG